MSITSNAPSALDEPTTRVGARTIVLLGLANLGMWMAVLTPTQVLLPQQIAMIDPQGKVSALGWITTCAAIGAIIACPVAGALSDRTTSRFGRRHPWVLGSMLVTAAGLALLSQQDTLFGVGACWFVVLGGMNAMYAGLTSVVPDRVPRSQRGLVSAVVGLPLPLGLVLGSLLVSTFVRGNANGYLTVAVLLLVLTVPLLVLTKDIRLTAEQRPVWSTRQFVKGFWISPRKFPDFGWAAGGRFAIQLCSSVGTLYLQYYLTDVVRVPDPIQGVFQLILIYTVGILLTSMIAGKLSDRSGRRKIFVIVASVVMGAAMLALVLGATMATAMVGAALLGLGYGVYIAVDNALITEVLPAARSRAKDLGVINLANSAPQAFAPALASAILTMLHSYSVLYSFAALLAILGAILIQPIKAVR